ncbi:hypothetical protein [Myxococcus phage Mx1]|nr:hypothetical protein [Myxococcus phage Mx1]
MSVKFELMPVVNMYSVPCEHEDAIREQFNLGGEQTTQYLFRAWGTTKHSYPDAVREAIAYVFAYIPDEYDRVIVKI